MRVSAADTKWIGRLQHVLTSIPDTLELCVMHSSIIVLPRGTISDVFSRDGHLDRVDEDAIEIITPNQRVEPAGETM